MSHIFSFLPQLYYYVPPCPRCGSEVTGRYVKQYNSDYSSKIVEDGLRHGEIIKVIPSRTQNNCFCLECNYEWGEMLHPKLIKDDELMEEIQKRHINELAEALMEKPEEPKRKRIFGIL